MGKFVVSLALVMVSGALAHGQTMGGPSGSPTTGGSPTGGAGANPPVIEKDIDLPVTAPELKVPPTPPQPPEEPPVTPPGNPPTIYGQDLQSENGTIFYVIDISGSMYSSAGQYTTPDGSVATGSKMDRAKAELTKSVLSLPKNFKFNMLAFDCSVYPWKSSLQPADDPTKNQALAWISGLQPQGATGTGPAMAQALQEKGSKLFVLLTDGAPNCGASGNAGHLAMINAANSSKATINTFGIGAYGIFKQFCIDIASQNGPGSYTDVK
ncbi:MAG: VWA domain-containing protein [Planctomycetota bacterium]